MTMMSAKSLTRFTWLAVAGLMLAACASQMEPAKQAIDGIESAVSAASADASKYIPEQLSGVQGKVAELKAAFDRKDYKAVIAGAPAVLTAAQGLAAAAAAKKDEVMKALSVDWTALSAELPRIVAAVKSRVDVMSKSRTPPAGVDLAAAKSALAEATEGWTKALAASASGNVEEAVNLAKMVRQQANAAAAAVKLTLPAG
jgi:hypothetical protein